MAGGENSLRRYQLVKMARVHTPSKEKHVKFDEMKAMCFLLSFNQKRYNFLLKELRDGDNVGRDEYPVMTTLTLGQLIRIEGGIKGNQ